MDEANDKKNHKIHRFRHPQKRSVPFDGPATMSGAIFHSHLVTTLMMTGLIWVIQLVHYPSFLYIDPNQFSDFEKFHSYNISIIVMPLMLIELGTAVALVHFSGWSMTSGLSLNLLLLLGIWGVTFFISSRLHGELLAGFDEAKIRYLVNSNWIRTFLWTARAALIISFLPMSKGVTA